MELKLHTQLDENCIYHSSKYSYSYCFECEGMCSSQLVQIIINLNNIHSTILHVMITLWRDFLYFHRSRRLIVPFTGKRMNVFSKILSFWRCTQWFFDTLKIPPIFYPLASPCSSSTILGFKLDS